MGIEETVARLRRQASEAQQRHAVAGGQHVQAQARAGALREDLKTEFGVATVAEAQVSLECKLFSAQPLGTYTLFIGELVMFHVADHLIGPRLHIDNFAPIGRLGSPSVYCRTTDRFDIARITYAQWLKDNSLGD